MQRGHVGHRAPAGGALRHGCGDRGSVVAERSGDVLPRERGEKDGVTESREPNAQGALRARHDEPVALGLEHLVEAVVGGRLLEP
jgi:hypothetical protein